ncbi:Flp pilus assembly protein CpaB [Roseovarius salinarum]|uniref:Flp pilus assembly protein CpaB n=1 Tax=Roseovarius salinarum TaxID=1981892 RepID=UPI000C34FB08|nr:Flp pilus assembly protein CpaB [Roseovarius salinarum]
MRMVFGLVLVVGLGLAGFAVYMAKNYIDSYQTQLARERAQNKQVETVQVFVANRTLKYGQPLTPEDVRQVLFPKQALPEGVFRKKDTLFPESGNERRVVLRTIEKNEALSRVKITEPGQEAGLTSRLDKGMRAFAIKVDVSSGVSGFLRPGDRVDIYWTGELRGLAEAADEDVTKLIETGVKLIAVDQVADDDTTGAIIARTVTVAATPQQVAALAQAQSTGRLSLSLVGANDDTVAEAIQVDQRKLLGIARDAPEPAPEKEECTIRTRRGSEVIEMPIPCTN